MYWSGLFNQRLVLTERAGGAEPGSENNRALCGPT